jgi:hypothetical protein
MPIAKKIFRLLIEYLGGIICSIITAVILPFLGLFFSWILKSSDCGLKALGLALGIWVLAGIPLGATLGIALVDRYILKGTQRALQIILGVVFGFVTSVYLIILVMLWGEVKIFDSFYSGLGVFHILCVLTSLLGYTIAQAKEPPTTNEGNSQKQAS